MNRKKNIYIYKTDKNKKIRKSIGHYSCTFFLKKNVYSVGFVVHVNLHLYGKKKEII